MIQQQNDINSRALQALRRLCSWWFGQDDMEAITVAMPLAGYPVSVLRLNLKTGRWRLFGSEARGTGLVSLSAYLSGINETEAAGKLEILLLGQA